MTHAIQGVMINYFAIKSFVLNVESYFTFDKRFVLKLSINISIVDTQFQS